MQNNFDSQESFEVPTPEALEVLAQSIECVLFASGEGVSIRDLSKATGCEFTLVEAALCLLQERLHRAKSGLQAVDIAGGWQLATRPKFAPVVARFLTPNAHKLTRPALETVTIIAYKQPCTQAEIEAIRGVACAGVLKTLEERALLRIVGRKPTPGRPILYGTTDAFLHHFGMASLDELPKPPDEEQSTLPFDTNMALSAAGMQADHAETTP